MKRIINNNMITLTEKAQEQLKCLMKTHNHEAYSFGVTGGGCSGFNYVLKDTLLADKNDDDEIIDFNGVTVILDGASIFALIGTEIDYKTDIMGSAFSFTNPGAKASCGCGTSFSV